MLGIALGLALVNATSAAHTAARSLLSHDAVKPGETFWAGIQLRMDPGWHTYWRNAGDSGKPATVAWKLPSGITAGEISWPTPQKLTKAGLTTYVYHNEAILLVPLTVDKTAQPGSLDFTADVRWLECSEEVCLPGHGQVEGRVTVGAESKASGHAAVIEQSRQKLPELKPAGFAGGWWESLAPTNDKRSLVIEWSPQTAGVSGDFFPFASDAYIVASATETLGTVAGKLRLRKVVESLTKDWPKAVSGLLLEKVAGGSARAFEVQVAPADTAPADSTPALAAASPSAEVAAVTAPEEDRKGIGLLLANLGFAFLGGLVLNLMPCVLPVIALKIFGFVNQAQESPRRVRQLGLIYGAGVVVSFLVLAGLVIGGKLVSWGAQFGDPRFVIAITILVCFIAMNLFGVFEVTLGGRAMEAAAEAAGKEGAGGAFFNGVLATVLGTSCSAPFLAGAIGYAYFQPPVVIALIFAFVGLGLAAPYVVLSFQPGWLRYLPKPGPWMEKFKVAMGFPMLATAAWLFSLIGRHHGTRGVLWIGVFLVILALSAWIFGEFYQRGRTRRAFSLVLSLAILGLGYGWVLEGQLNWRTKPRPPTESLASVDPEGIDWKPWSHDAVKQARDAGKVVFVDFTADWCLNCQANKRLSIEIPSVRKRLKELDAVALIADYTLADEHPEITEELARFKRNAVPLVLVYPKDSQKPPIVLPDGYLTPNIVLEALDKALE